MKGKLRAGLAVLLCAGFLAGGGVLLWHHQQQQAAGQLHTQARELVRPEVLEVLTEQPLPLVPVPVPEEPVQEPLAEEASFLLELDLEALRATNGDVLGWIHIPDSEIDYPIIRVEDNNEYLRRAWDGSRNQAGCIFLECRNSTNLSDFNTLIYGHYMKNGTMFGSLHRFAEKDYLDAHPCVYLVTDDTVRRYEVFSVYEADVVSDTYRLIFEDEARKQSCLDYYISSSVVESGLMPTPDDYVLTLSTCMGNGRYETRWVVQAVLTGEFQTI